MVNEILISYSFFYKKASNAAIKGSRFESIEKARNEYKKLLEEGRGKTFYTK